MVKSSFNQPFKEREEGEIESTTNKIIAGKANNKC
jgi:hypothetical protein